MRHKKFGRALGRSSAHRTAMFRNMVTSLFEHERIVTTAEKAKEVRPIAEKMITLAKKGDLHARRQALDFIRSKKVVAKLFDEIGGQFKDRNGGYTRILQTGIRQGDAASMAIIELVGYEEDLGKKEKDN
jgi:large subunit ribosomal protein L17